MAATEPSRDTSPDVARAADVAQAPGGAQPARPAPVPQRGQESPAPRVPESLRRPESLPRPEPVRRQEPLWRDVLGEQLRALRHARGETLAETARRAGVSPQYLSEVERGVKEPSSEMIAAVTGALGITLVDLVSAVADRLGAVRGAARQPTCRAAFALAA